MMCFLALRAFDEQRVPAGYGPAIVAVSAADVLPGLVAPLGSEEPNRHVREVNLPVHTVVFKGLEIGMSDTLQPNQFHQMLGRAGRTGFTSDGAVYVLAKNRMEENLAYGLFAADPQPGAVHTMNSP